MVFRIKVGIYSFKGGITCFSGELGGTGVTAASTASVMDVMSELPEENEFDLMIAAVVNEDLLVSSFITATWVSTATTDAASG